LKAHNNLQLQRKLLLHYCYCYYYYYYYYTRLTASFVSQYQKGKTCLDLNEARDDGALGCSGISWTICKQSAPCYRQTITPTPHHSFFTGWMLFLMLNQQCQSTKGNLKYTKWTNITRN